jgi:hypothetical protein
VNDASEEIQQELGLASGGLEARHVDALRLVAFKLQQLNRHVTASRGILNDLRMLRRVLVGERNALERSAGDAASEKDARSQRPVAR